MFTKYLTTAHTKVLANILEAEDFEKHYSLHINFLDLFEADANLGSRILKEPEKTVDEFEKCIITAQNIIINSNKTNKYYLKKNVHCRVYGLPICPDLHKTSLPCNEDCGTYLQLSVAVVRTTTTKMLQHQRTFVCTKCKLHFNLGGEYEQRYLIIPPKKCPNTELCSGTSFVDNENEGAVNCKDYQEIKVQEQPSKLGLGRMPSSMWVTLEDDLVDSCKPGDNITICGVVKRRWKPSNVRKKLDVELVFKAYHVLVNNNQNSVAMVSPDIKEQFENFWKQHELNPLEGRNNILKSICPEIFGMHLVKLAVAVVLAGGSTFQTCQSNKIRTRSEPHLLLVGDPGTGKSQLLRFAARIIPRSVLTTGVGSTSAGLTVTAVMEDGEWQLEAGALVMADGGICCIDEFNSMKNQDKVSIHEAMEQQSISVAKAGVVCKLSTRCTILAATNPKRGADDESFGIASPLLSRFDVVLNLKDKINKEWDTMVAEYVLNEEMEYDSKNSNKDWNVENLQAYFIAIKQFNPVLSPPASKILSTYYQKQRLVQSRNKARTTVRMLDSLIRLSQGHAKLMFRETVQVMDAIMALMLTEASMQAESSLFGLDFDLNAPFPQEPMETYKEFEEIVLQKLHLMHLIKDENNCSGYDTLIENYTAFVETQEVSTSENNDGLISQENSTFLNSFSPLAEESETSVNKRKAEDYANEEQITVFNTSRSKKKPKLFEQNQEHGFASCAPNKLFEDTQDFVVQKPCISNINSRDNITSEMNTEENASVKNKAKINKTKNILARFKKTPKIPDEQNATDNNENMDSGQMCTENKQHEEQIKEKCVYTETQQNTEFNYKENNSRGVFEMLPKIPEINCEPDIESKKKLKRKAKKNKALKETDLLNMLPSVADTLNFDDFNFDDDVNIDF